MVFRFEDLEAKEARNVKGGEGSARIRSFDDDMVSIKKMVLHPGSSLGLHQHSGTCEVIYVLEGEGQMLEDGVYTPLSAGSVAYCPEGASHALVNHSDGDLTVFAVIPKQTRG